MIPEVYVAAALFVYLIAGCIIAAVFQTRGRIAAHPNLSLAIVFMWGVFLVLFILLAPFVLIYRGARYVLVKIIKEGD